MDSFCLSVRKKWPLELSLRLSHWFQTRFWNYVPKLMFTKCLYRVSHTSKNYQFITFDDNIWYVHFLIGFEPMLGWTAICLNTLIMSQNSKACFKNLAAKFFPRKCTDDISEKDVFLYRWLEASTIYTEKNYLITHDGSG